jgi:hypothetical protein
MSVDRWHTQWALLVFNKNIFMKLGFKFNYELILAFFIRADFLLGDCTIEWTHESIMNEWFLIRVNFNGGLHEHSNEVQGSAKKKKILNTLGDYKTPNEASVPRNCLMN